jgi:segregation and condensation protein B
MASTDSAKTDPETAGLIVETDDIPLKHILEALLLASREPLSTRQMAGVFPDEQQPSNADIGRALEQLAQECEGRAVELKRVASGWRYQVRESLSQWVARLWEERPQRYSRALLETLALIAYRQPITRGDIEEVRGVSVSTNIIRTLQEREWIRVVGHRDVPGKPALFGTTREFLDYFNLASLDHLPTLAEIRDLDSIEPELDLEPVASDEPPAELPATAADPADVDASVEAEEPEPNEDTSAEADPGGSAPDSPKA